jgi:vacuolar-type H+-ATPase subunit I/STV1
MSVLKTNTLLLSLNNSQTKKIFKTLILEGLDFEILDPKELGKEWQNIYYSESQNNQSSTEKKQINVLSEVLKSQQKTGFINSFVDQRFTSSPSEMKETIAKKTEIIDIADALQKLEKTKKDYSQVDLFLVKNNNRNLLFAKEIEQFKKEFEIFLSSVSKNSDYTSNLDLHKKIGTWQAISFSIEEGERIGDLMKEFIKENYEYDKSIQFYDAEQISDYLSKKIQKLNTFLEEKEINTDNISTDLYKQFACLHGWLELENSLDKRTRNVFSVENNSNAKFAFLSFRQRDNQEILDILEENNISYEEEVSWNKEIVDWKSKGGIQAFQDIAQAIGTISSKEADPSGILAVFFMIFFAFCLNDVIYGLIVAAFTGFFLFTKPLKENFKGIFTIMFYSGLVTILLGMLTNSWAGDLFNSNLAKKFMGLNPATAQSTPINDVFKNFQLIDILAADANVPINQAFKGTSPILIMLILAIIIGFSHQVLAYILRIITNLRKGESNIVLGQLAWIFFLFSGIFYFIISANNPAMNDFFKIIFGVSLVGLLILNQATSVGGKILGFLLGPRGLFGLAQFGGNLISYSRIIAIGLTGSVIASIVNLLASIIFESTNPIIGFILALIVLVVGHTFNFVLGVFGAYINPIRLTYVEFMPNFFEGEARQLKYEKLNLSYLKLKKN